MDEVSRKTIFLSYKYKDAPRFDIVRSIAARFRFFSFDVILDQRSLNFGSDIKEFMQESIKRADAMLILLSEDYNQALLSTGEKGAGVRFEIETAISEAQHRPEFQIIPILLENVKPVKPFDKYKCASPNAIDEIITQLHLTSSSRQQSRILGDRYRVDKIIEQRGITSIFQGYDPVADLPIEIYSAPFTDDARYTYEQFERVVRGRSSAFSPFLLNMRDTYIDFGARIYIITESFPGVDLQTLLNQGKRIHPFGALLFVYQVALALHELHRANIIHGGLAPRCIRLNSEEMICKIVDFEFATTSDTLANTVQTLDGYPLFSAPERLQGQPLSIKQDIYMLGNLLFTLITGTPIISREFTKRFASLPKPEGLLLENENLLGRIASELTLKVEDGFSNSLPQTMLLNNEMQLCQSRQFIENALAPFLVECINPNIDARPNSVSEIIDKIVCWGIPPSGYINKREGKIANELLFT